MRQAIQTKFIGPTDTKGSRVKATAEAGSIILDWNHAFNSHQNHEAAALKLAVKLGWHGRWVGGGLNDGSSAFVQVEDANCGFVVEMPSHIAARLAIIA